MNNTNKVNKEISRLDQALNSTEAMGNMKEQVDDLKKKKLKETVDFEACQKTVEELERSERRNTQNYDIALKDKEKFA